MCASREKLRRESDENDGLGLASLPDEARDISERAPADIVDAWCGSGNGAWGDGGDHGFNIIIGEEGDLCKLLKFCGGDIGGGESVSWRCI